MENKIVFYQNCPEESLVRHWCNASTKLESAFIVDSYMGGGCGHLRQIATKAPLLLGSSRCLINIIMQDTVEKMVVMDLT